MGYYHRQRIDLTPEEYKTANRIAYLLDTIHLAKQELQAEKEKLRIIFAKLDTKWLLINNVLEICLNDDGTISLRKHR